MIDDNLDTLVAVDDLSVYGSQWVSVKVNTANGRSVGWVALYNRQDGWQQGQSWLTPYSVKLGSAPNQGQACSTLQTFPAGPGPFVTWCGHLSYSASNNYVTIEFPQTSNQHRYPYVAEIQVYGQSETSSLVQSQPRLQASQGKQTPVALHVESDDASTSPLTLNATHSFLTAPGIVQSTPFVVILSMSIVGLAFVLFVTRIVLRRFWWNKASRHVVCFKTVHVDLPAKQKTTARHNSNPEVDAQPDSVVELAEIQTKPISE